MPALQARLQALQSCLLTVSVAGHIYALEVRMVLPFKGHTTSKTGRLCP